MSLVIALSRQDLRDSAGCSALQCSCTMAACMPILLPACFVIQLLSLRSLLEAIPLVQHSTQQGLQGDCKLSGHSSFVGQHEMFPLESNSCCAPAAGAPGMLQIQVHSAQVDALCETARFDARLACMEQTRVRHVLIFISCQKQGRTSLHIRCQFIV